MKLRRTDILFSRYIRSRDLWTCQRCHRKHEENSQGLHCSHYFGRGKENTRFDEKNCIALCYPCHMRWGHGDEKDEYLAYMTKRWGAEEFGKLKQRAYQFKKRNDKKDLEYIKELLKTL